MKKIIMVILLTIVTMMIMMTAAFAIGGYETAKLLREDVDADQDGYNDIYMMRNIVGDNRILLPEKVNFYASDVNSKEINLIELEYESVVERFIYCQCFRWAIWFYEH